MAKSQQNTGEGDALLFVNEVAALLEVSESLVRRWIAEERIPSTTNPNLFGTRRLIKREDAIALRDARDRRKGGWPRGVKRDGAKGKKAGGDAR